MVAELRVDGGVLVVHLRTTEKVAAFHTDIRVPLGAIRGVRSVDKPWLELRGRRMAGTVVHGVAAMGTWIHGDRLYDFCVFRRLQHAVCIDVTAGRFTRLLVGFGDGVDAAAAARRVAAAAGLEPD